MCITTRLLCLDPYSTGILDRQFKILFTKTFICLDPYSNGILDRHEEAFYFCSSCNFVLIHALLEYLIDVSNRSYRACSGRCLDPYSIGILDRHKMKQKNSLAKES